MTNEGELGERLSAHLEDRYGICVSGTSLLQAWNPYVHRVDHDDGDPWVARVFNRARPMSRVDGDAEILAFLEEHSFPAERLVSIGDSVSTMEDGRNVLLTSFVGGAAPDGTAETQRTLGGLLGRLSTLPCDSGALVRDAGSWGGDPRYEGLPAEDIAGAKALLAELDDRVPAAYRERYESLRAQLDEADPLADLPRALVHPDCAPVNAIASATGELVLVDWTAAGRGPRIAALGWLLWGAGSPSGGCDPARADAIAEGYGAHVRLEPEERARLRAAMRVRPLYFGCWYFHRAIVAGHAPSGPGLEWSSASDEAQGDAIAARARKRFETLGAVAGQS